MMNGVKLKLAIIILMCLCLVSCGQASKGVDVSVTTNSLGDGLVTEEKGNDDAEVEEIVSEDEGLEADINEDEFDSHEETYDPISFTVCFAGDISLADNSITMENYKKYGGELIQCIDEKYLEIMEDADILFVNNEFCYSERGEKTPGKLYHFRGKSENVSIFKEMGVDIVDLANNHVFDYGADAFKDTLDTLDGAGIMRVGAGMDLEEASRPLYVDHEGITIAFVAASRAEKNVKTPCATEDSPGIMYCYDEEMFLEEIKEARSNADIVIAVVHWGTEYSYNLEEVQVQTGHEYIDAGADAVIGGHSHCLQGIELYNDKPIFYSLGNFWFNSKTLDTMLVELKICVDGDLVEVRPMIVPGVQKEGKVKLVLEEDAGRIYGFLEELSPGVEIDEYGIIHQK